MILQGLSRKHYPGTNDETFIQASYSSKSPPPTTLTSAGGLTQLKTEHPINVLICRAVKSISQKVEEGSRRTIVLLKPDHQGRIG